MKKNNLFLILLLMVISASHVFGQNDLKSSEYVTLIIKYLEDKKSDFKFESQDLQHLVINNTHYSESTDITQLYVNQTFEGIRIFNAISSVAVKDGKVFYYANRFLNAISSKVNSTSPSNSPVSAIQKVATQLELGSLQNIQQLEQEGNRYVFSNAGISTEEISAELVYVKQEESLLLAWDFIIYAKDNKHWWSVRVNALNNEIIEKNDLILSCTFDKSHKHSEHTKKVDFNNLVTSPNSFLVDGSNYNVFALPIESPNHGVRQIVSEPASDDASPFGWHDDNGIIGAEYTIARGNNVYAKDDIEGNNPRNSFSPNGTATLNFDFPLDFNLSPLDYQEAAITNLFYLNNMMHDIWFQHGFNESAGNFQKTNYSNLGSGNDFVFADAQDGSGFNNANFGTPPDGFNPRMQMFLWSPPGVSVSPRVIIDDGSLAGTYEGVGAGFGDIFSITPITSSLVLATDTGTDIYDACEGITNSAALNGNIAVIRRGTCEFGAKVLAAENAGAVAAIVVNNEPGAAIVMGAGAQGDFVSIPSLMLPQAIGESLISALINGDNITASLLGPDITDFIDGDFDNGIIAHEYGHGISNRLAGGPAAANCLFNNEQMGEGWSDWFGLMVTMKPTDVSDDGRGIGTFAISQPVSGGGIRPARYTTDFSENGFTYNASNTLAQPHGIGFVWATVLWDLTWAYIDKYGFDSDLYNGNGGNNRVMKLVIDGLKLQPCSPGFVDGRDAILAADMATTGGVDQCIIWEVFAARGLGFGAQQGSSDSRIDQMEDFTMPPSDDPSLANCSSLSVDEFSEDNLKVFPNPTQTELIISTRHNYGSAAITLVDINGRVVLEMRKELFNAITINTSQLQSGLYILNIKGDNFNYNEKIIKN
ncbi:T9SS-dependent M36 family metallopeptidase [Winogradskyella echinorum]|uniref:T9SS-dependent M36 family metallopeptidase n=1 Tax=Winogradskyella echinorum TaxID=538189 RepID=A0ABR6XZY4_9FLAO|nr:T9SS-dependent M36 family metallopeptidase [Winogradskyella echinorum]MBC3846046.1 T9SS-dependent M36 family metallopeptidase [Winogradskyella echinorum]MBC5750394.1 T9SS-dependent M36 family metallopeptidase [Winogradskyella echinorum]